MTVYKNCPACGRKGWFAPRGAQPRIRRCRYCHHDNGIEVAAANLQRTLGGAQKRVHDAIDKGRKR